MSYDGVVTRAMVRELSEALTLGKIEKIYQPQPEQLLFVIHTQRGKRRLFLSASGNHSAAYLVSETPENPAKPPVFCMVLRKHLNAARITSVTQHENDRIIEILLETTNELGFAENRKLIVEIMGKHSNVLLINMETGRIIDSIKHVSIDVNRARQILPGKAYEYPPAQSKIPFTEVTREQMTALTDGQLQPERSLLAGIQGISPVLAQAIASGGDAYTFLRHLIDTIDQGTITPLVYLDEDDKPVDFHILPLSVYEEDPRYRALHFDTLSEAAGFYFAGRESSNTVKQKSNDLQRVVKTHLDKLKLKMQRLEEDLFKAENSDKYRLYGELLTANLHLVNPGMKEVTVTSYYDGADVKIPLDPKYTPAKNAQHYFKRYAKAKTAIKEKKLQIEETTADIEYLESVASFVDLAKTIEEIDLLRRELVDSGYIRYRKPPKNGAQKKYKPQPYTYKLTSGKIVMAGRNNNENDWLTMKKASGQDLWFHTKDIPGSHVILFLNGNEPTEEDLCETAAIAAYHSKFSSSGNVPVDYTKVRYVKKPSGAKPGFVIFTHNRTLYVDPRLPAGD
ncbi:MAG: NFACT family protein [Firmicutes bacterium]|nr:NFACT family protein [Bacillota bacterium]